MKIPNEIKVGLLAILVIGASIWGYFFLKGKNLLAPSEVVYVDYHSIEGLKESDPIMIQGLQVGIIRSIEPVIDQTNNTVLLRVAMDFSTDFPIPKDATAIITSNPILGGASVRIDYKKPCLTPEDCLKGGDFLKGSSTTIITDMISKVSSAVSIDSLKTGADSLFSSITENAEINRTFSNLNATLISMKGTMDKMGATLDQNQEGLSASIKSMNTLMTNLDNRTVALEGTLKNVEALTSNLNKDLPMTTKAARDAMQDLSGTMETTKSALASINALTDKIQSTEGTIGKLLSEDQIYDNLDRASFDLDKLLQDLRLNPKRYISLFDKKKRRTYTYTPLEDDPANQGYQGPN